MNNPTDEQSDEVVNKRPSWWISDEHSITVTLTDTTGRDHIDAVYVELRNSAKGETLEAMIWNQDTGQWVQPWNADEPMHNSQVAEAYRWVMENMTNRYAEGTLPTENAESR